MSKLSIADDGLQENNAPNVSKYFKFAFMRSFAAHLSEEKSAVFFALYLIDREVRRERVAKVDSRQHPVFNLADLDGFNLPMG